MRARTIKTYVAVAAAVAVSFGSAAAATASFGSAAPASTTAQAYRAGSASAATQSASSATIMPTLRDDPHGSFDAGDHSAVLCATAIEYGLIA
jgi:hypothetical protein